MQEDLVPKEKLLEERSAAVDVRMGIQFFIQ